MKTLYGTLQERADNRPQFVTVFCDASHCPRTLATGWAVWMKYGRPAKTERLSGALRDVRSSHYAELHALEQALTFLEDRMTLTGQIVVIESDCKGALAEVQERAMKLTARGAKFVKLKWVKGHQGVKCARSAVNTWCDTEAKQHMRKLRDQIIRQNGSCNTVYGPKRAIS